MLLAVKADAEKGAEIEEMLKILVSKVNGGDSNIGISGPGDGAARARQHSFDD